MSQTLCAWRMRPQMQGLVGFNGGGFGKQALLKMAKSGDVFFTFHPTWKQWRTQRRLVFFGKRFWRVQRRLHHLESVPPTLIQDLRRSPQVWHHSEMLRHVASGTFCRWRRIWPEWERPGNNWLTLIGANHNPLGETNYGNLLNLWKSPPTWRLAKSSGSGPASALNVSWWWWTSNSSKNAAWVRTMAGSSCHGRFFIQFRSLRFQVLSPWWHCIPNICWNLVWIEGCFPRAFDRLQATCMNPGVYRQMYVYHI